MKRARFSDEQIVRILRETDKDTVVEVARSGLYYEHKMPGRDLPVIDVMRRLSGQYPRFGSRRIRVFLAREGLQIGKERCSRLWSQAGLQGNTPSK